MENPDVFALYGFSDALMMVFNYNFLRKLMIIKGEGSVLDLKWSLIISFYFLIH